MTIGIYGIFSVLPNQECLYIGQSKNIEGRWQSHLKRLRRGVHLTKFNRWFEEHGSRADSMEIRTLEETEDTDQAKNEAEIKWFYDLSPKFYGQVPSPRNAGWSQAEETKQKISLGVRKSRQDVPPPSYTYNCETCGLRFVTSRKKYGEKAHCSNTCVQLGKKPQDIDMGILIEMYFDEGISSKEVGKFFGVSDNTVLKLIRNCGLTPRPRNRQAKA